jgi:micrococcal nuclease
MILLLIACLPSIVEDTSTTEDGTVVVGVPESLASINPDTLPQNDSACREPELVEITHVVDGDTFDAIAKWGGEKVRMIGINTPEIGHDGSPDDCYGEESAAYTESVLDGNWAWLSFDVECEDQYGRTLAYVTVSDEPVVGFFQRDLLRQGLAEAFEFEPNVSYADLLSADESYAANRDIGLWGDCR